MRLFALVALCVSSVGAASFCDGAGWSIEWRDEFDADVLDETKWRVELSPNGTGPLGADCHGEGCDSLGSCRDARCTRDNVYLERGNLVLRSRWEGDAASPLLTTGAVNTWDRSAWSSADEPFRLCVRARLPGDARPGRAQGLWPAHWMMPHDDSCDPDEGEMDIMEMVSGEPTLYSTYHWQTGYPASKCAFPQQHEHVYAQSDLGGRWNETYHEFAVERGPGHVAFALDGAVTLNSSNASFWNAAPWYLILNTAVGGGWPGPVNATETVLPAHHAVDYVRVARRVARGAERDDERLASTRDDERPARGATEARKPHIVAIIADDYGWANVGFHQPDGGSREVVTPNLDALARSGVELRRHYTYSLCSPSRSSFQSGRLPVHVNVANAEPTVRNPADPVGGYAGIPVNMTGLGEKMRAGGYATAMTGKWDAGMATPRHSPHGRGYDTWLGYFHHANDYWSERLPLRATGTIDVCANRFVDLWEDGGPAASRNGTAYEEELFTAHTLDVICGHNASVPLFLVHAFHITHTPLQVPKPYLDRFAFIEYDDRRHYAAMVSYMDGVVGQIVGSLRAKAMWERTLLLFTSDNGGAIYRLGGANNHPLKGGKYSDWEGGVRMNAFLAGGFLPPRVRGVPSEALMHMSDWYTTFSRLAGVDEADAEAKAAGLPPVDGVDQWPVISGAQAAARHEIHHSSQALTSGRLKIVTGRQMMSGWTGATYPNASGHQPAPPPLVVPFGGIGAWPHDCKAGCLYDVFADPNEHDDLAAARPATAAKLAARLAELNKANYNPDRGRGDPAACAAAERNGGFYGPFVGV